MSKIKHLPTCRFGQVPTLEESPNWAGIIRECTCHEKWCRAHPDYMNYITERMGGIMDLGDGSCNCR